MTPEPSTGPPAMARALARLTSGREDRALLLGDLEERFHAIADRDGRSAARRWYWSQALRGLHARLLPDVDLWSRRSWQGVAGDVRQSARALRRRPLYAVGVAATLSIGLASAAAVSAVAWHVWLAPMSFPDPDRVVRLYELEPASESSAARAASTTGGARSGRSEWRISPPLLEDLRAHDWATVESVAGVSSNVYDWTREGATSRLPALVVSPELFGILGITPIHGRPLSFDEDAPEVVLGEPFWERVYGGDPGVVGRDALTLNGRPHTIVGVVTLPAGYPDAADVMVRLGFTEEQLAEGMRGARYLDVVARVDPTRSVGEAAAEMDRVVGALGERHSSHAGWGGTAIPLSDELIEPYRSVLGLLIAAGATFLLLAVVNVAGLAAARTVEGGHDRAVRLALGASEARLLRATTIESLLLGVVAALAALAVAYWLLGPLTSLVPGDVPRIDEVRLSAPIAGALLGVAFLSGGGVGVLGYALSRGLGPEVARGRRTVTRGLAGRGALVIGQVALTTLLVTAGAGILRQMGSLQAVDLGFRPEGVVASQVFLSSQRYPTPEERLTYWRTLIDEARARGLRLAVGTNGPMAGANMPWGFRVDDASEQSFAQYHPVSADYFRVLGIDLLEGRVFGEDDREGSEPVVIINDALARERFPGQSAVGRTILLLNVQNTIVGVVRSTRHFGPGGEVPEEIYAPIGHDPWPHQVLAHGDDEALVTASLASLLAEADPALGVPPPTPYTQYVSDWFATLRLQAIIVGLLATVGTLLATLGLYALVAYQVGTRQREIGVRIALGASDSRMFTDVVRGGLTLAVIGMAIGFGAWYLSLPATGELLGDVDSADPLVPIVVALLVGTIAALASALPARRSVGVDPAITLRAE
jgi:predicted permease